MINSGNGYALWRITKLIRTYLVRDMTPPLLPPPVSVPAELQHHYAGHYQIISPREQWHAATVRAVEAWSSQDTYAHARSYAARRWITCGSWLSRWTWAR
jgi:hypothetical protein